MRPRNSLPMIMTFCAGLACNIAFTKAIADTTHITAPFKASPGKQIFGYYTNWDTYDRNYQPADIPLNDITAALYAFAQIGNCAAPYATDSNPTQCNEGVYATGVQDYKLHSTDPGSDFYTVPQDYKHAGDHGTWIKGNMGRVIQAAHAQQKPAILSILGYSLSVPFQTAIDDQHRAKFIKSIIDFLALVKKDNNGDGFDGIDVDWEPNDNQWTFLGQANAIQILQNYLKFIDELRTTLKKDYASYAWLTVALPANPAIIQAANQLVPGFWQHLANQVDYMDVMTYDYHGAFDVPKYTNFLAPLNYDPKQPENVNGRKTFNITSTINAYLAANVPASKIIVGIPAYGRAVEGVAVPGIYQNFTGPWQGEWDNTGTYDYKYIFNTLLADGGFKETHYPSAGATAAFNATTGVWISYDNLDDIKAKTQFIIRKNLGGLMLWSLSGDLGLRDPNYAKASLLHNSHELLK